MLKKKSSLRHTGAFWAFVAPCCILFGIFFLLPLVLSIAFSMTFGIGALLLASIPIYLAVGLVHRPAQGRPEA